MRYSVNLLRSILILSVMLTFFGCNNLAKKDQVCFKSMCVDIAIARTKDQRAKGLQFIKDLQENSGMLFIFPSSSKYSFWMKDTLIPLDIIWMDYSRNIVHIEKNVSPCSEDPCHTYSTPKESLYVLEVNSGYSEKMGIKIGDRLEFYFD